MSPAHYLMESYLPRTQIPERAETIARVRRAARAVSARGTPVRHIRSLFIPADESWFHIFESGSPQTVRELALQADLEYERIVEVLQ
jgi:hypothetical protein